MKFCTWAMLVCWLGQKAVKLKEINKASNAPEASISGYLCKATN
jgi:hypothetical protein